MRIGVYGGSFNPPHTGHVLAASELNEKLGLDRLLIVPAADPPHKKLALGSPGPYDRLALCTTAFYRVPKAQVCDLELRREGKSYTVDTLAELKAANPGDELFLVMGTDMFLSLTSWREPERIAALATLAVVHRGEDAGIWDRVLQEAEHLRETMQARIVTVDNECVPISSTMVRRMLAFGAPDCLDPAVLEMIRENGWYLSGGQTRELPYDKLKEVSLALHDEKRRAHVVGTADTAFALAERWGADPEAARRAGILHDITKALTEQEQLHFCREYGMMPSEFQYANPKLLHAVTGAAAARRVFGESETVVSAIRWHTTGRAHMSALEKILYLADYMEPNRDFPGVEKLRELVWKDLDAAMLWGLEHTVNYVRSRNRTVDPDSLEAWNYYREITERS